LQSSATQKPCRTDCAHGASAGATALTRTSGDGRAAVFLKLASEKIDDRAADLWVPDLNLPLADVLPTNYVQSEAVRLEIYGRVARCRSEDDLEDLEEETARRFDRLPQVACDFFAAAKLRLDCRRRGIVRLATFLPGRLRKSKSKSLERNGDRVVYAGNGHEKPFERVAEFLEILDE
jgi:transcription-repair coupling factor (superfamily II helicase)